MMHKRGKLPLAFLALLALIAALGLAACGGDDGNDTEVAGDDESNGAEITVAYASPVATQPHQADIQGGMERAAESLGWNFEVLDGDLSPDRQVSNIDTMINSGTDGIISWTLDPGALDAAYERAADAGIPLVGLNSEGEYLNTEVWVEVEMLDCENDEGSKQRTVDFIQENADQNARVLVVGPPPVPSLVASTRCFIERAEQAGLEILGQQDNVDDQSATATPLVEDMLSQHGEVDAIWSYNDSSAIGAGAAVENQGFEVWTPDTPDGIIVSGLNGDSEAIDAIRAGRMSLTWDGFAAESGAAAIRALVPVLSDGEDVSAMPGEILLDTVLITAENADEFVSPGDRDVDIESLPIIAEN